MQITITEFRKNLFQVVERVLKGEQVLVAHKGQLIRLTPEPPPSKLSLMKRQDLFLIEPEDLETAKAEIRSQMMKEWDEDWTGR